MRITIHSVDRTRELAARLAAVAQAGDVFGLVGDLGAGKTEFVRGFVGFLNEKAGVRSPSFSLVNSYDTNLYPIHHFDFYRLSSIEELVEIGFDEYIAGDGICLIEWADMFPEVLPETTSYITFTSSGFESRVIQIDESTAARVNLDTF